MKFLSGLLKWWRNWREARRLKRFEKAIAKSYQSAMDELVARIGRDTNFWEEINK